MNFYLAKDGQKLGPYSAEQIQVFLTQGLVSSADQVWAEGWPSWMAIGNVPGLTSAQSSHTPYPGQPSNQPPQSKAVGPMAEGKSPFIACLLSLLIVGLGQFYNGDWVKGWFMLITCIFATVFSAGAMWLFWALFSAFDAYRVASKQKPLGQYYPL